MTDDASLGVGHIWTNITCPAYRTLDGADCICGHEMTHAERATCDTCGQEVMRDWSGWMHVRKPARRHVVVVKQAR